jgi:threonine aldolase
MEAVVAANKDHAVAYGADPHTEQVVASMREMFGPEADPCVVFSGTGANVLAIKVLARQWEAVVCPATAHINENETGSPEALAGCKLFVCDTSDGKLTPAMVERWIAYARGNQHRSQPRVVSVTQPTELGTLYTVAELRALADCAHHNGMFMHVDGARLGNAVAATGVSPREMITDTGVDAVCFGGTKNGMMAGEIVVFLRPGAGAGAPFCRKQLAQLPSKQRFVSAQFNAYLKDGLWLEMAGHANRMAALLCDRLAGLKGLRISQKVEANTVFAELPREVAMRLRDSYHFNIIGGGDPCTARWICSFDTTEADIDAFVGALRGALKTTDYGKD